MKKKRHFLPIICVVLLVGIVFSLAALCCCVFTQEGRAAMEVSDETQLATQMTVVTILPTETALPTSAPTTETTPSTEKKAVALQFALEQELEDVSSEWSVYAEDLYDGTTVAVGKNIDYHKPMISASIIKIFIMGAIYDEVSKGTFTAESVYDDVFEMITVSDNDASNRLTLLLGNGDKAAGFQAVTRFARSIGCNSTSQNRLMMDLDGNQNYVSVGDCATFLRLVNQGKCVSEAYSELMLEILLSQKKNGYLPAGVPEGIAIAHKGGDLPDLCLGSVGIVFAEGHPYIACIICNNPVTEAGAREKLIALSAILYEYLIKEASTF